MRWSEIRKTYPDQWVIIEAVEAYTSHDKQRHLEELAVIETCPDGTSAMRKYRILHQQYPHREFYFVHTRRKTLHITERQCLGIQRGDTIIYRGQNGIFI